MESKTRLAVSEAVVSDMNCDFDAFLKELSEYCGSVPPDSCLHPDFEEFYKRRFILREQLEYYADAYCLGGRLGFLIDKYMDASAAFKEFNKDESELLEEINGKMRVLLMDESFI